MVNDTTSDRPWFGLVTDYRRLFDALEGGWLRPSAPGGQHLGVARFIDDESGKTESETLRVGIRIEPKKLPPIPVAAFLNGRWGSVPVGKVSGFGYSHLRWPGALPAFAFSRIVVRSDEERDRLLGLAEATSNLVVPQVAVESNAAIRREAVRAESSPTPPALELPRHLDAHHGAMSMAVYYVPRMEPWLRLLEASLDPQFKDLSQRADDLDAGWWKAPPWAQSPGLAPDTLNDLLWRAAAEVFRQDRTKERPDPRSLAGDIHTRARRMSTPDVNDQLQGWLTETERILSTEQEVLVSKWRRNPVGLAIQLVLTRPDPWRFSTWLSDRPDLPPGVAWSAAALCGLLSGYRRLEARLRGPEWRREALAIHAVRCSASGDDLWRWPSPSEPAPHPERNGNELHLRWDGRCILKRNRSARDSWLDADFRLSGNVMRAKELARRLRWSCLFWDLKLPEGRARLRGRGEVNIVERGGERRIAVADGGVTVRFDREPSWTEVFDERRFRRCILTETGLVDVRPTPVRSIERSDAPKARGRSERVAAVPGLSYSRDFISVAEERELLDRIEAHQWDGRMQRRVQHYGWRYDYKARRVDESQRLGPLPDWLDGLASRLVDAGLMPRKPDQVIINEYIANQGIAKHIDARTFEEHVAMLSLREEWPMVFKKGGRGKKGTGDYHEHVLAPRSVAVLGGPARWDWTHEIPKRKKLPGSKRDRGRRVSLTFRRVIRPGEAGAAVAEQRSSQDLSSATRPPRRGLKGRPSRDHLRQRYAGKLI